MQLDQIGVSGSSISLTGPAKSEALLRQALEQQVGVFVIESPAQIELLEQLAKSYDYEPQVLLRLQIEGLSEKEGVLGGGAAVTPLNGSTNGARTNASDTVAVAGFHVFQWSQVLEFDELERNWRASIEACLAIRPDLRLITSAEASGSHTKERIQSIYIKVSELLLRLKQSYELEELYMELGRYLVGPYGYYFCRVLDRKQTYGRDILVLEGGIHHLLRPALLGRSFPVSLLRHTQSALRPFALHGPLCTSLDSFGVHELPSDVAPGDLLLIHQVGAYGFTESMPLFLCHNWAGEAVIERNELRICRRPQSASTWLL